LELLADEVDGITVVTIRGRVDSTTSPALEERLLGALQSPDARLVADMSGVEYLSSAGLRVMLVAMQQARKAGARLVLHGLTSRVREVFEISGFISILPVCASREEALAKMAS
jgi:anti-sigma B factor antagonist/stage II sporulation protein AA (anti-sigma F factor antagonist)